MVGDFGLQVNIPDLSVAFGATQGTSTLATFQTSNLPALTSDFVPSLPWAMAVRRPPAWSSKSGHPWALGHQVQTAVTPSRDPQA